MGQPKPLRHGPDIGHVHGVPNHPKAHCCPCPCPGGAHAPPRRANQGHQARDHHPRGRALCVKRVVFGLPRPAHPLVGPLDEVKGAVRGDDGVLVRKPRHLHSLTMQRLDHEGIVAGRSQVSRVGIGAASYSEIGPGGGCWLPMRQCRSGPPHLCSIVKGLHLGPSSALVSSPKPHRARHCATSLIDEGESLLPRWPPSWSKPHVGIQGDHPRT